MARREPTPSLQAETVGVIADTHGLLRPRAVEELRGCELILHAGDIGALSVLEELEAIAPVAAVRGNVDVEPWAGSLPEARVVEVGAVRLLLLHDLNHLMADPTGEGLAAVISGHSHRPEVERRAGVLFLNPGSAGPRRFRLPVTLARLTVQGAFVQADVIDLAR